jgi:hypothetical protein
LLRVLTDHLLVRGAVDAINLIVSDVAVDPLDLRAEVLEDGARRLRGTLQVRCSKLAYTRHVTLNHKLRHELTPRLVEP